MKEIFSLLVAAGLFGLTYLGLNAFLGRFITDGVPVSLKGAVAGDAMQVYGLSAFLPPLQYHFELCSFRHNAPFYS